MSKPVLAVALVCAAAGVSLARPAPAPGPTIKVAIVPGIAVNLDAARVDALSQELADALQSELVVDATGGLEVRRSLPAEGLPADCVAQKACIDDVARRLGADQLLFVVMVDTGAGGAIQLDSTWVEPSTGNSAPRPAIDIASLADAKDRFTSAAPLLLPDAPRRPKPIAGGGGAGNTRMSDEVPRHFTTTSLIMGGVAVAGLGVGIGFGLSTRSKFNDCDNAPVTCTDDKRDKIRRNGIIADVGYVVALGAAVTTVVLYATSGKESQLVLAPVNDSSGGTGAAAFYSGRF